MFLAGAFVSQVMVLTSWDDDKAGTVVNLVMVAAAAYGYSATQKATDPERHPHVAAA